MVALAVGAACWSGCGRGDAGPATTAAALERFDPRPALPSGWRRVVNARAGFSVGVPPGWRATGVRATLVRSRDGAVSVGISADRSDDGQSSDSLPEYARRTLRALGGYRGLRVGTASRLSGTRYPTATARARGTFVATGVPQDILAAAIRRPGRVTFTMVFFRNARTRAAAYRPAIAGMIRSFSAQPPTF